MANFPSKEQDFFDWQTNFMMLVLANLIPWAIVPGQWTSLTPLQTTYLGAYNLGKKGNKANRNPTQTKAKNDATKSFKGAPLTGLRTFIANNISKNPLISNALRLSLQTTIYKTTKTKIDPPSTVTVLVGYDNSVHNLVELDIRDASTPSSKKKVAGIAGFELWGILVPYGKPAPTVDQMVFMSCYTVSNPPIPFPEGSSGGTFYGRARWYNPRHQTGEYGDVFSFMVG